MSSRHAAKKTPPAKQLIRLRMVRSLSANGDAKNVCLLLRCNTFYTFSSHSCQMYFAKGLASCLDYGAYQTLQETQLCNGRHKIMWPIVIVMPHKVKITLVGRKVQSCSLTLSLLHQRKPPVKALCVSTDDATNTATEWADEASAFGQMTVYD